MMRRISLIDEQGYKWRTCRARSCDEVMHHLRSQTLILTAKSDRNAKRWVRIGLSVPEHSIGYHRPWLSLKHAEVEILATMRRDLHCGFPVKRVGMKFFLGLYICRHWFSLMGTAK